MTKNLTPGRPVMIGGGGHALSLVSMAPAALKPECYVDFSPTLPSLTLLGDDDSFLSEPAYDNQEVVVTFVAPRSCSLSARRKIIDRYAGRRFATIVSPEATIAPDVYLGAGSAVFRGAVINTGSVLGNHAIVNTGAIIEHGVTSGQNVFFGPGSVTAGDVTIGENVYIGAGVSVRNSVKIADNVTIGVGSAVVSDLIEPGVYGGVPAKLLKKWE